MRSHSDNGLENRGNVQQMSINGCGFGSVERNSLPSVQLESEQNCLGYNWYRNAFRRISFIAQDAHTFLRTELGNDVNQVTHMEFGLLYIIKFTGL